MDNRPADLPLDELRERAPESGGDIDALHAELGKEQPSKAAIDGHVESLRRQPRIVTLIENWFDDPRTQTFLSELSATGL